MENQSFSSSSSSQVQQLETTVDSLIPNTYRHFLERQFPDAVDSATELYSFVSYRDNKPYLSRFEECRTRSWFVREVATNKVHVFSNSCRLRWCPFCQRARKGLITKSAKEFCLSLKRPKFCTLTFAHSNAPLKQQVTDLYAHFRKFRMRKDVKKYWHGGIWFFQVKLSDTDNCWHPHLHILLDAEFLDKRKISELWLKQTKTSFIIDIREVTNADRISEYVARYCSNPVELSALGNDSRILIYDALQSVRLFGKWGTAKNVPLAMVKKKIDGEFVRLGSWRLIIEFMKADMYANLIFFAWRRQLTVPSDLSFMEFENFIDEPFYEHDPPPTVAEFQQAQIKWGV